MNADPEASRIILEYLQKTFPELQNQMSIWILEALSKALEKEHLSAISYLLQFSDAIAQGYEDYFVQQEQFTLPLDIAAKKNNCSALISLLRIPTVAKHANRSSTVLTHTYLNNNIAIFNWLLDNAPIECGWQLIRFAVCKNDLDLLNKLLSRPDIAVHTFQHGYSILDEAYKIACEKDHRSRDFRIVDRLLEQPMSEIKDLRPIIITIRRRNSALFHKLVTSPGATELLHSNQNQALYLASGEGLLDVVNTLLLNSEVASTAHIKNNRALQYAARNNHTGVVSRLRELDNVRNARASTPDLELLRFYIRNGNLVELQLNLNQSALNVALNHGQFKLAHHLNSKPETTAASSFNFPIESVAPTLMLSGSAIRSASSSSLNSCTPALTEITNRIRRLTL